VEVHHDRSTGCCRRQRRRRVLLLRGGPVLPAVQLHGSTKGPWRSAYSPQKLFVVS
jgi:hypothetical protein